jgi:AcrR family transcriptional regulator
LSSVICTTPNEKRITKRAPERHFTDLYRPRLKSHLAVVDEMFPLDQSNPQTLTSEKTIDATDRSGYFLCMQTESPRKTKRDELIEIASSLFYKQGYGATGIKQIIDTAGIAKGTFYSHFESKEEVGLAWLRTRHTAWNAWLNAEQEKSKTPKGQILALFDFLEDWMMESEFRGCAFLNSLGELPNPDNPMRKEIVAHKSGLHEAIQGLATQHFSAKSRTFGNQKGTAIFLLFEGALVETQNFRNPWPIKAARKEVMSLLSGES